MPRRLMHKIVVNELVPDIGTVLRWSDGTLVDLTGATSVRIKMFRPGQQTTGPFKVDAPVTDYTPAGRAYYQWAAGDTDELGLFYVRWVVAWTDPVVTDQTFPTWGMDEVYISP